MPNTAKLGLPYPNMSDLPSIPAAVQALADAIDAYGVIGGKRRTSTSAGVTTVEAVVIDTQTLALAGNSVFRIDYDLVAQSTVGATDPLMRIRTTSVSGTILAATAVFGAYTTQGDFGHLTYYYKTTAAETVYFCGTMSRQSGTGTLTAVVPTSLIVSRVAPSSLIGDF